MPQEELFAFPQIYTLEASFRQSPRSTLGPTWVDAVAWVVLRGLIDAHVGEPILAMTSGELAVLGAELSAVSYSIADAMKVEKLAREAS
jgi:hypothetical protein